MLANSNNNLPIININPGPYDYKLLIEGNYYPHLINLSKLVFTIKHQNHLYKKIIFLTTGHSFANSNYISNFGCEIKKTTNFTNLLFSTDNLFYSIDDGFNDFALISFGSYNISETNQLKFLSKSIKITGIARNFNISQLEKQILIKNSNNTGESFAKAVIDFSVDKYIKTYSKTKQNFYTFKINRKIIIVASLYPIGLIIKNCESKIAQYNGTKLDVKSQNELLKYHFASSLSIFAHHNLFNKYTIDDSITEYYSIYTTDNKFGVLTLMGDSGAGFHILDSSNNGTFLGINICSSHMIILSPIEKPTQSKTIYYDSETNRLVVGPYIIEEVHKTSQVLPFDLIEQHLKSTYPNIIENISV